MRGPPPGNIGRGGNADKAERWTGCAKWAMVAGMVRLLALVLVWALTTAAGAADLAPGGAAVVAEVVDGDTVVLADGRQVRLVGLQAPKLPLGRPGFRPWPLADEAKAALEALVLGRPVTLRYGGRQLDRHGRALAHLFDADGRWVQGALLEAGWARVYSFPDNRARVAEMYALERTARAARRGIWGHPFYALRSPEETGRHIGTFQVVEGRVLDAARVRGRVYLNFGPDWRTDFTVSIPPKVVRLFKAADIDPLSLEDRVIRVRGWLKKFNGPMIEASHPEQVEVVGR